MSRSLSETTIATVKATVPALELHAVTITRRLYEIIFEDPAIRALFDMSRQGPEGSQPVALAAAIVAYAKNVDRLEALAAAVERVAQRHVRSRVQPRHYETVGTALLRAVEEVLGEAATPAILDAWGEAYRFLADILIGREQALYAGDETPKP